MRDTQRLFAYPVILYSATALSHESRSRNVQSCSLYVAAACLLQPYPANTSHLHVFFAQAKGRERGGSKIMVGVTAAVAEPLDHDLWDL